MVTETKSVVLPTLTGLLTIREQIQKHGYEGLTQLRSDLQKLPEGSLPKDWRDLQKLRAVICDGIDLGILDPRMFQLPSPQAVLNEVLPKVIDSWVSESPSRSIKNLKYEILRATACRDHNLDYIQIRVALSEREILWHKKAYYQELYRLVGAKN